MKAHTKAALICTLALLSWQPVAASDSSTCAKYQSKRTVTGLEPDASKLYKAACLANAGPWEDGFTEESFTYLGKLQDGAGNMYAVAFLSTIWGSSGRATNRLLVFRGNGDYLGRFSNQFSSPALKRPFILEYPNSPKLGNKVSFKNGIPSSIWVDGENQPFEAANQSSKRTR
jgi:hypothetical protein